MNSDMILLQVDSEHTFTSSHCFLATYKPNSSFLSLQILILLAVL